MGNYHYWDGCEQRNVSDLIGLTLKSVTYNEEKDEIFFITEDARKFIMHHEQSCCENVYVEAIVGDLDDLVGTPIVLAEESSNSDDETSKVNGDVGGHQWFDESHTWTFYRFRTMKGDVDIRWYGSSNGYYSESVSFTEITNQSGEE